MNKKNYCFSCNGFCQPNYIWTREKSSIKAYAGAGYTDDLILFYQKPKLSTEHFECFS